MAMVARKKKYNMDLELIKREPVTAAHPTPLLFVHGMWHGAWCWEEHFLPYFAQHGYKSYALSLRGHGASEGRERLRWTTLADYVDDVTQVVNQMEKPPVMVGLSMGGMIVQKYLESHQTPAAILMASLPPKGIFRAALRVAYNHPIAFLKANLTMSLIPVIKTPDMAKEMFFSADMSEEKLMTYFSCMQDESYRAFLDTLALNLPRPERVKTPMLVLGGDNDTVVYPSDNEATARAYGTKAEILPGLAHAMMLEDNWQAVADRILEWLSEKKI